MTEPGQGAPVRSLWDGEAPDVGARVEHRANGVRGEVVRVVQRRRTWVLVERPVPKDYPYHGTVLRDVELRLDVFHRLWKVL